MDAAWPTDCAPGCELVTGYPIDEARGCVDTDARVGVACACGEAMPSACRQYLPDGSFWVVPADLDGADWGPCGDERRTAASSSCDFAHCEVPPPSSCSLEDFCATTDCGGLQYRGGCARPVCERDADCDDGKRCVALECLRTGSCSYSAAGVCQCDDSAACAPGSLCVEVEQVGPAGDWESLRVEVTSFGSTVASWTVTPDGVIESETGQATLSQVELDELRGIIDGPELRAGLARGQTCVANGSDALVFLSLSLSSGLLGRGAEDRSECVGGSADGAIGRVYSLVREH